MNPIDLLRNSIEYDQSVRQISLNQLRGSNEVLIVKFDASLDEDQKKAQINNTSDCDTIFFNQDSAIFFIKI